MARNTVLFQKGLSEPAFEHLYGTAEQCRAVVVAARSSDGFTCPVCGGREHSKVTSHGLFQCIVCRRQTSPIAGTICHLQPRDLRNTHGACSADRDSGESHCGYQPMVPNMENSSV
jgi:hypothetical protein